MTHIALHRQQKRKIGQHERHKGRIGGIALKTTKTKDKATRTKQRQKGWTRFRN